MCIQPTNRYHRCEKKSIDMLYYPILGVLALSSGVLCGDIQITLWQSADCTGDNDLKPTYDLQLHRGCNKRGDVAEQLQLEMREDLRDEKALSAYQDGSMKAQSQFIAFFTSDNCDPSTIIKDAYVDNSCSNVFESIRKDTWKSYEMRDACVGGFSGCNLEK